MFMYNIKIVSLKKNLFIGILIYRGHSKYLEAFTITYFVWYWTKSKSIEWVTKEAHQFLSSKEMYLHEVVNT